MDFNLSENKQQQNRSRKEKYNIVIQSYPWQQIFGRF